MKLLNTYCLSKYINNKKRWKCNITPNLELFYFYLLITYILLANQKRICKSMLQNKNHDLFALGIHDPSHASQSQRKKK